MTHAPTGHRWLVWRWSRWGVRDAGITRSRLLLKARLQQTELLGLKRPVAPVGGVAGESSWGQDRWAGVCPPKHVIHGQEQACTDLRGAQQQQHLVVCRCCFASASDLFCSFYHWQEFIILLEYTSWWNKEWLGALSCWSGALMWWGRCRLSAAWSLALTRKITGSDPQVSLSVCEITKVLGWWGVLFFKKGLTVNFQFGSGHILGNTCSCSAKYCFICS